MIGLMNNAHGSGSTGLWFRMSLKWRTLHTDSKSTIEGKWGENGNMDNAH